MSISLPNLDDRRWSDLVEQGRALIPLYAPEWTDHNASDPGITLMELFAWVAEMDIYQLNRLTDSQKLRLLRLMGIRPQPPRPATVVVELQVTSGASPVALGGSLEFAGARLDGGATMLRSKTAIDVVAVSLRAVQRKEAAGFQNVTAAWARQEALPLFGEDPLPGAEIYLGFDEPLPVDTWAQVYFCIDGTKTDLAERRRLVAGANASAPSVHHSARIGWEYLADAGATPTWLPLEAVDDTRSFTLSGAVRLKPASGMKASTVGRVAQPLCWVRCRFKHGAFDEAPRAGRVMLNAVELVQSVSVWTSWPIAPGTIVSGTLTPGQKAALQLQMKQGAITSLALDASSDAPTFLVLSYVAPTAKDPGILTVQGVLAGTGTALPEQTITLGRRPLVESTLQLFSLEGTLYRQWQQVDDFTASTRADAHFQLDPTRGDIVLGNGEKGRVLPNGSLLFAFYEAMQATPSIARVSGIADSPHNRALLPDPSVMGRIAAGSPVELESATAAETLAHALGRAIESREARLRAVTIEDFEAIAAETPGLKVARAIARPNLYPGLECVSAPGVVAVIVLPSLPLSQPLPSSGFIEQVAARLERRRTVGTRVVVAAPRYLEVAVRAQLKAFDGIDKKRLARHVAEALDAFFHPLRGGPAKAGWPLGRDVYRAEVMQVIDETAGVDHVLSLELMVQGCTPNCGNVCLRPTWLVAAGVHEIEVP